MKDADTVAYNAAKPGHQPSGSQLFPLSVLAKVPTFVRITSGEM